MFYDVFEDEQRVFIHRVLKKPPEKTTAAIVEAEDDEE